MDLGFDFQSLAIGGVLLIPLIIGLVEFSKKLGVVGKWLIVEAFALGDLFGMLAFAIESGLIPLVAVPWIAVVFGGLGCAVVALSACGLYDMAVQFRPAKIPPQVAHHPKH